MDEIVELNVGGTYFTTTRSTLCKEPSSMLACMFSGDMTPSTKDKHGRYFIDRSGQHFGTVLAYLRGERVDMLASRGLIEEAKYYQLEGVLGGLMASPGSSVPETASSLEHCCEVLRHNVGCDVIDAVEGALMNLWAHRLGFFGSTLDWSSYKSKCNLTLWMKRCEFEHPVCTDNWQSRVQLCCSPRGPQNDQIRGADAASFTKILCKCYGIIVKDLREKGFTVSMKLADDCNKEYDMAAYISVCPLPALFG